MKKIVKLTENDLMKIVKRVINEDQAEGISVKYKLNDFIQKNPGTQGQFKIEGNTFVLMTPEGRRYGSINC